MPYSQPVSELIRRRFSCRTYLERPIGQEKQEQLEDFMSTDGKWPFGTQPRFALVAATEEDRRALKGLGTYGIIKGATGFVIGAVKDGARNLEDFGYQMERIILYATELGLGTCWLGGTFTKSRFAKKISATKGESVPAVTSIGYVADQRRILDSLSRWTADSDQRLPWERLFFDGEFGNPLSPEAAGAYAEPLDMVRLGPSASNKQPWQIVKVGDAWHLFLRRSPGYREQRRKRLFRVEDLQRIDMGIAMSHFQLTAEGLGLTGRWVVQEPGIQVPNELTEYSASWVSA